MSISDRLTSLFGSNDSEAPTTEALESLFRERKANLDLTAEFHLPNANLEDEPTAVFPYTLLNSDGEVYGSGAKEFFVPDNGFNADEAAVTEFLGGVTETPTPDVGVGSLRAVEGATANARLNDNGDVVVEVPDAPEAEEEEEKTEDTADDAEEDSSEEETTDETADEEEGGRSSGDELSTSDSDDSEGGDE